jgi:hypothetical protein
MAGLLIRLLLAIPADLWSRVWSVPSRPGIVAGALSTWLENPLRDVHFMHQFVLATWWLGAVFCGLAIWRRPGPRIEVVAGVIAGGAAGLAGSATLACLLCGLDALPRWVLGSLFTPSAPGSAWTGTVLWIIVAVLSWAFWGGLFSAALAIAGAAGFRLRGTIVAVLVETLRSCGLGRAAAFFASS